MTYKDDMIHSVVNGFDNLHWRSFDEVGIPERFHEWYYAENDLYVIRDKVTHCYQFVEAGSPWEALMKSYEDKISPTEVLRTYLG